MAISYSKPEKWTPVYNKIIFDILSDNILEPNFKYKIELTIQDQLEHTSRYLPNPNGHCIYNAGPILKNYIDYSVKHIDTGYEETDEVLLYYITIYECYESIPDTVVGWSGYLYTYTGVANYEEAKDLDTYTFDNFIPQAANDSQETAAKLMGPNKYPLTNIPKKVESYNLRTDQTKTVKMFSRNIESDYEPNRIYVYTKLKNEIGGDTVKQLWQDISINANTDPNYDILTLSLNIDNLNATGWDSTQTNPGLNNFIDPEQDAQFLIFLANDHTQTHKFISFNIIECDPSNKDRKTIMYKSRHGGMWYIDATQKSYESLGTKKQIMNNYLPYDYNDYSRVENVIEQKNNSVYTVNTDWIKHEGDLEDIKDMLQSPLIYLIDVDDKIIPVTLLDSDYEFAKLTQGKKVQYSFSFREAHDKNIVD